jgi:hypothetical protein
MAAGLGCDAHELELALARPFKDFLRLQADPDIDRILAEPPRDRQKATTQ